MNDDFISTDSILAWLKLQVEHKRPMSPDTWLYAGERLNILKSDDNDRLIELEHELAVKRASIVKEGGTSASAKIQMEADEEYVEVQKLKAKLKMVEEAIRLAKLSARIKSDELRNNL